MPTSTDPRQYLIKAKVYRVASLLFLTIGVFVFGILFVQNVSGRISEAMREPATVLIFIIPFLPAAVLTLMADRFEKKYLKATSTPSSK